MERLVMSEDFEDSILGDIAADIPDNPFYVGAGTHKGVIIQSEKVVRKDGEGAGWALKYQVDDTEDQYDGNSVQEWKNLHLRKEGETPEEFKNRVLTDPNAKRDMSYVKSRMKSLGVPDSKLSSAKFEDFLGLDVYFTVKETPGTDKRTGEDKVYTNVTKVELVDSDQSSSSVLGM